MWDEPAYRNFHGLLEEFGDAEVGFITGPRALIVEAAPGPDVLVAPAEYNELGKPVGKDYPKGKPGQLSGPDAAVALDEYGRYVQLTTMTGEAGVSGGFFEADQFGSEETVAAFLGALGVEVSLFDEAPDPDETVHWLRVLPDAVVVKLIGAPLSVGPGSASDEQPVTAKATLSVIRATKAAVFWTALFIIKSFQISRDYLDRIDLGIIPDRPSLVCCQ
jgi:hypothetical protein